MPRDRQQNRNMWIIDFSSKPIGQGFCPQVKFSEKDFHIFLKSRVPSREPKGQNISVKILLFKLVIEKFTFGRNSFYVYNHEMLQNQFYW